MMASVVASKMSSGREMWTKGAKNASAIPPRIWKTMLATQARKAVLKG
jgi:hypothetical protein